jgi:ribosomal protein S18 acetylase RimI-like enzyme
VDRSARRRGLGWAVTQALVEVGLERSEAVVLGVDEDNLAGRSLYRTMGFRLDHELVSGILPPR